MERIIKGVAGISKHPATSSVLKISDIVIQSGLATVGAVVPGVAYKFSKIGLGKLREYVHNRNDQRVYEFHKKLLCRDDVMDEEILKGEIDEANYHALLNACLSDIEDEKTTPYANLTRAIALGKVSKDLRRHFALSLKDVAWEDLDFLKQAYVISNNEIIPSQGGGSLSSEDFLVKIPGESVRALSVKTLTSKGFIEGKKITPIGIEFVKACSSDDDLTPGVYGYRVWTGHNCDCYLLTESGHASRIHESLQIGLRSIGVKSHTPMEGALDRHDKNMYTSCAILIYMYGKSLNPSRLENLKYRLGKNPVVQVVIDDDCQGQPELLIPGEHVVLNSVDSDAGVADAINKLVQQINTQHRARENLKPR